MLVQWETVNKSKTWTDTFCCDDGIGFQLAHLAFKDSPGECHFVPKKGAKHHSGRQTFFACKGRFVNINTTPQKFDLARKTNQKMKLQRGVSELELGQALGKIPLSDPGN